MSKEKNNLPLKPVTFGALALYSENQFLADKFRPMVVAEKLANDHDLLKKVWNWTIDSPLPDRLEKQDATKVVKAMWDFLLLFRESFKD